MLNVQRFNIRNRLNLLVVLAVAGLVVVGIGSGWMNLIVGSQPGRVAADFGLAENIMKYLVNQPPKPDYDYRTFDYDRDVHLLDGWSKLADAKNPDLSEFRKRGGKIVMTYGWADPVLQPMMGVSYYEQVLAKNGPGTPDFFRLFMIPGMSHCGGGIGPNRYDAVTALVDWVEMGKAPAASMRPPTSVVLSLQRGRTPSPTRLKAAKP